MGLFDFIFKSNEALAPLTALSIFPDFDFINLPEDQFHKLSELMPSDEARGVALTYVKFMEENPEHELFTYCKVTIFKNGNKNIDFTNDTPETVKIEDVEKFTNLIGSLMGPEDGKDGLTKFMMYEKLAIEGGFWTGRLYMNSKPSMKFTFSGYDYSLHISMG